MHWWNAWEGRPIAMLRNKCPHPQTLICPLLCRLVMFTYLPFLDFTTVSACLIFALHSLWAGTPERQRSMRQNDKKVSWGRMSKWKYKRGASVQVVKMKIMHSLPTKWKIDFGIALQIRHAVNSDHGGKLWSALGRILLFQMLFEHNEMPPCFGSSDSV